MSVRCLWNGTLSKQAGRDFAKRADWHIPAWARQKLRDLPVSWPLRKLGQRITLLNPKGAFLNFRRRSSKRDGR